MGPATSVAERPQDGGTNGQIEAPQSHTPAGSRSRGSAALLAAIIAFVLLTYTLFATGGMMTTLPATSRVYELLAESFMQGRLDLLLDPPPQLATVANPYDPAQRAGIDVSTDATYFGGRYYAYWGPAPAVLLALWKVVFQGSFGDGAIAFAAAVASFLLAVALLLRLRRLYFPDIPTWLVAISIMAAGMAHPILWNLNYPAIYEAAIGAGQAFLFAGLYLAVAATGASVTSRRSMALVGAFWGLAIASRFTLVPAVGVLLLGTLFGLAVSQPRGKAGASSYPAGFGLMLPLILVVSLLGLYNYLRFGKVTETGLQYQLVPDLDYPGLMAAGKMFNPEYVIPGALHYFFSPAKLREQFPFVESVPGGFTAERGYIGDPDPPRAYSVDPTTGVVVAAPFILFSGVLVAWQIAHAMRVGSRKAPPLSGSRDRFRIGALGVGTTIAAAAALTALPTLAYRHVTNRFELDYVPLLIIASSIGAWQLHQTCRGRRTLGTLLNILIVLSVLGTLLAGVLLGASRS